MACARASIPLRRAGTASSVGWPCAEQAAQHDQLTDVIRRVVRDEQYFTQVRLAISIRHASREIGFLVDGQRGQVGAIATKSGDALVPGLGRRRLRSVWPISFRPRLLLVVRRPTKL